MATDSKYRSFGSGTGSLRLGTSVSPQAVNRMSTRSPRPPGSFFIGRGRLSAKRSAGSAMSWLALRSRYNTSTPLPVPLDSSATMATTYSPSGPKARNRYAGLAEPYFGSFRVRSIVL